MIEIRVGIIDGFFVIQLPFDGSSPLVLGNLGRFLEFHVVAEVPSGRAHTGREKPAARMPVSRAENRRVVIFIVSPHCSLVVAPFHYTKFCKKSLCSFLEMVYNSIVILFITKKRMIPMANHEELVAEVKNLAAAPSVYSGLKDLAEQWLAADGTAAQANLTALLRAALKEDVCTIDELLPFFASDEPKGSRRRSGRPDAGPGPEGQG